MAQEVRQSPRAAICSWLRQTNNDSRLKSNEIEFEPPVQRSQKPRRYKTRYNREITSQSETRGHPRRVANGEGGEPLQRDPNKSILSKSHREEPQNQTTNAPQPRPGDPGFAESLGLHPPFRTFRLQSEDTLVHQEGRSRTRKRKRKAPSTLSYLEPAVVDELTDAENGKRRAYEEERTRTLPTSVDDGDLKSLSGFSRRPDQTTALSEKPAESYGRRPRHKTREDRYELKDGTRDKKKVAKDSQEKKPKKHKRREKSGAALMHSFTAQNVSHDRLTLQPGKALGLFGKGRASSPVRRRGLPDSAFSETAFLNSHRPRPEDNSNSLHTKPSDKKKNRKTTKAADIEAEISRYFTSAKVPRRSVPDPHPQEQLGQQKAQRQQQDTDSPPTCIDLPDKPFLGFGSSGGVSISPVRRIDCRALIDQNSRITRSQTRSTSYFTWSQSGVRSQASPQCRDKVVPLASSQCSNRRTPPASSRAERPQPIKCSPAGRHLSGSYRDAATGTTPPDRLSTNNIDPISGSPVLEDRRRGGSVCSLDHIITRGAPAETESRRSGVEPGPKGGQARGTSPSQSETKSHQHSPCSTTPVPVIPQCRQEAHTAPPQVFPNRSIRERQNSPYSDPLEAVLAELLQEGKQLSPVEGLCSKYESQRPRYIRPEQQRTIKSRSGLPPNEPSPRVKPRPHIDRFYDPSLQLEHVASKRNPVDSLSRRYHGVVEESQHGQDSACKTSSHSVRSLTRPSTMEYVADSLPTPGRSRVDSRNASNGYASLYERQQSREDGASFEGHGFDTESLLVGSEVHGQPDGYAMPLAYRNQGSGDPPVGVEDHFNDYRPGFQEGPGAYHHPHECAEHVPTLADDFANQSTDYSAWVNRDQPFLSENDHEFESADLMDSHYDGLQLQNDQIMSEPDGSGITNGASSHNPWPAVSTLAPRRGFEASSITQDQVDDPRLSHFWTPHKLY